MNLSSFGLDEIPSDGAAAWLSVILMSAVIGIYVVKKTKFSLFWDHLRTTNNRKIGTFYLLFGFLLSLRVVLDALFIRLQLAVRNNEFWVFQFDKYDEVFTTHGTMMIFFAATPMLLGLMNVAVPLQIGARDLAFPYLNAVGFWLFF